MSAPQRPRRVVLPHDAVPALPAEAESVRLASSGWYVRVDDALADRAIMSLLGSDAAWFLAVEDWRNRQPLHEGSRVSRLWRAEERHLAAEQAALVATALELSVAPHVSDPRD